MNCSRVKSIWLYALAEFRLDIPGLASPAGLIPSNGDAAPEPISSEPNLTHMATQYQRRTFPFVLEKFTSAQQFKKTPISRSDFRLVCHKGFVQAFELRRIAVFPSVNTLMKTSATLTGFEPVLPP